MSLPQPGDPNALHELFDVSVLFDSSERAQSAWAQVFKTTEPSTVLSFPNLNGLASLNAKPLPSKIVDLRLVGEDFDLGRAFIGLNLGLLPQLHLREMNPSAYPDPWAEGGRMRLASLLVGDLLALGGHAVVLHKAAAVVKSARLFQVELGDLGQPSTRPFLAWLDTIAYAGDGTSVEARSYGMPHYFGAPNFRAVAPRNDAYSLERAMQAVKFVCGRIAAGGDDPLSLKSVAVPLWYQAGRGVPGTEAGEETLTWAATPDASDATVINLGSDGIGDGHPQNLWNRGPGSIPFDMYTRAIGDLLAHRLTREGLALVDFARFEGHEGRPPVRVLVFERPGRSFLASAGFGKVRAAQGTDELATAHAEFCLYGLSEPALQHQFELRLLSVGLLALATPMPGGLKDWDGLPPGEDGWGFLIVPMDDIPLSVERPVALRLILPVTRDEAAQFRAGVDRPRWYRETIPSSAAVAARWEQVLRAGLR
jgi:hypothetical protein